MMKPNIFGRCVAGMWILAMLLLLIFSDPYGAEAASVFSEDFDSGDGGFTVVNAGQVENPWFYNTSSGTWLTNGCRDGCGIPGNSELISPQIPILNSGTLTLSFDHRYSFEYDGTRWDGGQVRISKNGGSFVPVLNFTQNGYDGIITGTGVLNGQPGFNGDSPGYSTPSYVMSVADLGFFNAGDTLQIMFLSAWDECSRGFQPNWQIDQIQIKSTVLEGCSPGFWQGGNNLGTAGGKWLWNEVNDPDWVALSGTGYNPYIWTTPFNSFFTPYASLNGFDMMSLLVSGDRRYASQKAGRSLVAAYLNASWGMNYPYTTGQLSQMWADAVVTGDFMSLHLLLDAANNSGTDTNGDGILEHQCPINAGDY